MRERLGFRHEDVDPELNQIVETILASVREVRTILGAGLLEEAYEAALLHELSLRGVKASAQVSIPLIYKGVVPLAEGIERFAMTREALSKA